MRKKITISILIVILICVIAILQLKPGQKQEIQTIKVGITIYDEYDPFIVEIGDNIVSTLTDYQNDTGINVVTSVVSSNKNQLLQNDQVDEFIEKDYDVICVNLVDRTDATVIIEKARTADIPIIFFNRELVEDDLNRFEKLYYVGAEPEISGAIQGQIVVDLLSDPEKFKEVDYSNDGTIQYVILEGEAGHQDALVRTRVAVSTIENAGFSMEKLGDEIANWDRKQAQTKINSLLSGYLWKIELIIANDDNMALGAIDAYEAYGVDTLPIIVGVNGQTEALEAIKDGKLLGTALNNAPRKGEIIGQMAYSLATDGSVPEEIQLIKNKYFYVPYERIDINNVSDYLE